MLCLRRFGEPRAAAFVPGAVKWIWLTAGMPQDSVNTVLMAAVTPTAT